MAMPSITPYSHWQQRSASGGFPQPALNETVSAHIPAAATPDGIEQLKQQKLAQAEEAPQQEQPPQIPSLDTNGDGSINELDSNPVATDPNNQTSPPIEGNNSNITDPLAQDGGAGQMPGRPPAPSQNKPPIGVTAKTAVLQRRSEDVAERVFAGTVTRDEVIKLAHDYGVGTEITEAYNRTAAGEDPQVVYRSVMGLDDHGVPLEKSAGMEKKSIGFLALSAILAALGAVGTPIYRAATGTSQGLAKDAWQGGYNWSGLGLLPTNLINKDLGDAATGWAPSMWGARGSFGSQHDMTPEQREAYAQMSPEDQKRFASGVMSGKSTAWDDPNDPALRSMGYRPSGGMQAGAIGTPGMYNASPIALANMMGLRGGGRTPFGHYRDEDLYRQGLMRGRKKSRRRRRRRRGGRGRLPAIVAPAAPVAPPAAPDPSHNLQIAPGVLPGPSTGSPAAPVAPAPVAPAAVHPGTSPDAPFPSHPTPGRAEPDYTTRRGSIPDDAWGDSYKSQANSWATDMSNPIPPENVHTPIPGYNEKGSQYLALVEKSASDAGIVVDPLAIGFVAKCCERGMNADQIFLAAEKTAESFPELAEKLAMDKEAAGWLRGLLAGAQAIPKMFGAGKAAIPAVAKGEAALPFLSKIKSFLGGATKHVGDAARAGAEAVPATTEAASAAASAAAKTDALANMSKPIDVFQGSAPIVPAITKGPLSKAPWLSSKDALGNMLEAGKINRVWNAPWAHPFRGAATGGLMGMSIDEIGDLTGAYDTGGMGAKLGLGLGFGFRSPWASRAAAKALPGSAAAKALSRGKNMTTMGGWHQYGRKVGWPTEAAFWAPLPLSLASSVGESKAVAKGDEMAQQMGFDTYQDLLTSPVGQGIKGYNKSGILGALSGVWGSLSPQQKTTMIAALGLGGAGLVSAMSGKTGLGLGLGAAGLGVGAYGMGAFGNAPGSLESVLSGADLSSGQADQLQDVFNDREFADQFYNLPKGQQSAVMQNILKQLQAE